MSPVRRPNVPALRVVWRANCEDGLSFDTSWTYDASGRAATVRSPGSVTTTTWYGGLRPQSVFVTAGQMEKSILNLAWLPFGPRTRAELDIGMTLELGRHLSRSVRFKANDMALLEYLGLDVEVSAYVSSGDGDA